MSTDRNQKIVLRLPTSTELTLVGAVLQSSVDVALSPLTNQACSYIVSTRLNRVDSKEAKSGKKLRAQNKEKTL